MGIKKVNLGTKRGTGDLGKRWNSHLITQKKKHRRARQHRKRRLKKLTKRKKKKKPVVALKA